MSPRSSLNPHAAEFVPFINSNAIQNLLYNSLKPNAPDFRPSINIILVLNNAPETMVAMCPPMNNIPDRLYNFVDN